jgi:molybdenum cofactor cytidylyltransferase
VDRVLVVLGHRSEEIARNLEGSGAEAMVNPRWGEGMLTSVQAGAAAASPDAAWLLIALGDQPSLQPATVETLLSAAREDASASIVVPSYSGRRGHPLLIHCRHREEIAALDPEIGLRQLMQRHPDRIRHVLVAEEAVLADMDTPEEYERELRRLAETDRN